MRRKVLSFAELVKKNKEDILKDEKQIAKIEEQLETRRERKMRLLQYSKQEEVDVEEISGSVRNRNSENRFNT